MRVVAYSKKGTTNMGENSNAYLVKRESDLPILGYGDLADDVTTSEKGVIAVFEAVGNGDGNLQTAYAAAKELGISYVWDEFIEHNVRKVNDKILGKVMGVVAYIDEMKIIKVLNVGNMISILLRDKNVEELTRVNKYIMGNSAELSFKTSFRMMRSGDVLLLLNSAMFEVLYSDLLKAAKFEHAKEKVEYLNRKLKVHEQMYDYMNDSSIVMVYELCVMTNR